ncbi:hypothetical protein ACFLWA_11165 [Chloroflexota bacterium]
MSEGLTTRQIMNLALQMAGFEDVPPDSAIYVPGQDIKRLLFGIDVESAELHIASQMGYDAAVAHHPTGCMPVAWPVFYFHVDQMVTAGVPEDVARRVCEETAIRLRRMDMLSNYDREPSIARLLGLPYMSIHSPLDEIGRQRIQAQIDYRLAEYPDTTLTELIAHLKQMPEYQAASTEPEVVLGNPDAPAGHTVLSHAALDNGGFAVADAYFEYGVDTVVYIHLDEPELERLQAIGRGQIIVLGHIASDSVGINPFLDALEERGIEVTRFSGVIPGGQN